MVFSLLIDRSVPIDPDRRQWILSVTVLAGIGLLIGGYQLTLLTETLLMAIFALAFNLLYGYTGLLSFGHAMFVAIAGYTVALVSATGVGAFGGFSPVVTFGVAVALGVLLATLLAIGVGYLAVQLQEIYFAMLTLSFSMALYIIVQRDSLADILGMESLTNGSDGLTIIFDSIVLFGRSFELVNIRSPLVYYYLVLLAFVLSYLVLWRIVSSPFGTICLAIRENPERAQAVGIDVRRHSWATFVISGAVSGLAGALLVPLHTNVGPSLANWTFSAHPVIMTVIGGPYSFVGPVVGAFVYNYLRWFISQFQLLEAHWQLTFGLLLLFVVLFFENGVSGGLWRLRSAIRDR